MPHQNALRLSLGSFLSPVYFMPFLGSQPTDSETTPVLGLVCCSLSP